MIAKPRRILRDSTFTGPDRAMVRNSAASSQPIGRRSRKIRYSASATQTMIITRRTTCRTVISAIS